MVEEKTNNYGKYALVILIIVYIFNFIDRQILTILAENIKEDLGISDADIGFLYGTAFAVFYAIFGIPLGRLADIWVRKNLISYGLAFWSFMTAMSGTAQGFTSLAVYRFGVGIGESSASPAAFSMLSDYFHPRIRATILALYSSGIYIGAGIGVFLGGWILSSWEAAYPDPAQAPFGLKGWQAAFFAVGIPGLLMALWVHTLREPERGVNEGIKSKVTERPMHEFGKELMAVIPPFTLFNLWLQGAGRKGIIINLVAGLVLVLLALLAINFTGDVAQWGALAVGIYATFSWLQKLYLTDSPSFDLILRSKALLYSVPSFASISFVTYGLGLWIIPFFIRIHGLSEGEVGIIVGISAAVAGLFGVTSGGVLADYLVKRTPAGRLYIGLISIGCTIPCVLVILFTKTLWLAFVFNFFFGMFSPMWVGAAASTVNDMVLPRMRALASALYILVVTFIGLALGPYLIGKASDILAIEMGEKAGLTWAMALSLLILIPATVGFIMAIRYLPEERKNLLERAKLSGESI